MYLDGYLHDIHEAEELMLDVFAYLFTKKPRIREVNCTPFVRQYGILFRKWGVFVCQRDNESTTERRR